MPKMELFFDLTCPYCYKGHALLMQALPQYPQVEILWRPVEAHPKAEEPEHKPYVDLAVQGALCVRAQGGDEKAYYERVYRARFEQNTPVDDIAALSAYARDVGVDRAAFEQALRKGVFQQAQLEANDYAYEAHKVWAVPTFVCGDKRLDSVEGVGVTLQQIEAFFEACCG